MTRYEEALEQQALLRDRLTRPEYNDYAAFFLNRSWRGPRAGQSNPMIDGDTLTAAVVTTEARAKGSMYVRQTMEDTLGPDFNYEMGNKYVASETSRLEAADPYFCTTEMMPLVKWAAAQLPDDERWHHDVWPTDYGFVWFEEPYVTIDLRGEPMIFRAMTWGRYAADRSDNLGRRLASTLCFLYVDGDEQHNLGGDVHDQNAREILGKLQLAHSLLMVDGEEVGPAADDTRSLINSYVEQGFATDMTAEQIERIAEAVPTLSNDARFIMAFLMLLDQTVTATEEFSNRQIARRMRRMKMPERVSVVRLRRIEHANKYEGETNVEWAHRWVVRGHWRKQPYKDDGGKTYYQRIWIAPYVKGPEDKPLRITKKIYALER